MDYCDQVTPTENNSSLDNIQKKVMETNRNMEFKFFEHSFEPPKPIGHPENERKLKLITNDIVRNYPAEANFTPNFDERSPPAIHNKRFMSKNNLLHIELPSGSQNLDSEAKKKTIFHHFAKKTSFNASSKKDPNNKKGSKVALNNWQDAPGLELKNLNVAGIKQLKLINDKCFYYNKSQIKKQQREKKRSIFSVNEFETNKDHNSNHFPDISVNNNGPDVGLLKDMNGGMIPLTGNINSCQKSETGKAPDVKKTNQVKNAVENQIKKEESIKKSKGKFFSRLKIKRGFNSILRKIKRKFKVINPNNPFVIFFKIFIIIISYIHISNLILQTIYQPCYIESIWYTVILGIFLWFFSVDILINFCTGFYERGQIILDKSQAFKNYYRSFFYFDLIALISVLYNFLTFVLYTQVKGDFFAKNKDLIINLVFIVKLPSILHDEELIKRKCRAEDLAESLFTVFRFLKNLFLLFHIFACLFYLVIQSFEGDINNSTKYVWTTAIRNNYNSWIDEYFLCFLWSLNNVFPLGGQTFLNLDHRAEVLITIVANSTSILVLGYSIYEVHEFIKSVNSQKETDQKYLHSMIKFMKINNVDFDLKMRVKHYLDYIMINKAFSGDVKKESEAFSLLCSNLRRELTSKNNERVLSSIPHLINNFSHDILVRTLKIMVKLSLGSDFIVFKQGQEDDQSIYFLEEGTVNIILESTTIPKIVQKLEPGSVFGDLEFFTDNQRQYTAKTSAMAVIYKIRRKDFIELLSSDFQSYEKFCMIRDSLLVYHDYSHISTYCFSCEENNHVIKECPLLSLLPDKNKILRAYINSSAQKREAFNRISSYRHNALKMIKVVREKAQFLVYELNKEENYVGKLDNVQISFIESPPDSSKKSPERMPTDKFSYLYFDNSPNQMGDTLTLRTDSLAAHKLNSKHFAEIKTFDNISSIVQIDHDDNDLLSHQKTRLSFVSNLKSPNLNNSLTQSPSSSPLSDEEPEILEEDVDLNKLDMEFTKTAKRETSEDFSYYSESKKLSTVKTGTIKTSNTNKKTIKIDNDDNNSQPFFIIRDFDRMWLFNVYFPHNNYEKILLDMKKIDPKPGDSKMQNILNLKKFHYQDSKASKSSAKSSGNTSNFKGFHSKPNKSKSNNASFLKNSLPSNVKKSFNSKPL